MIEFNNKIFNFLLKNISPKQIVLKNTFWLTLGQIFIRLFKFLLVIFAARILGPEGWGSFQYLLSIASMFFIFADFGVGYLIIRDYQQKKDFDRYVNVGSFLIEFLTILSLLVALIFSLIFESLFFKKAFIILIIFLFLKSIRDYILNFFKAIQKMEFEFLSVFVESLLILIFGIIFLLTFKDIISFSLAYLFGILFSLIFILFPAKRFLIYLKPKFNLEIIKYYLKNGLPLALFGMLGFIFFTTDQIILGKLKGTEMVGYYSIASRIVMVALTLPFLFLSSLFPQIALNINNKQRLISIFKKSSIFILSLSLGLFILIYIFADLVPFVLGNQYIFSVKPLRLISFILFLLPLTNLFDHFLFSINKQWQDFIITLICAVLNLILNLILIPQYAIYGAIYATLISQFINLLLTASFSFRYLKLLR
ncbi:MAG: succinoglycan biosynthesis transporter [Candidatus Parcubacteria bacterium]|nr:MAG: succinoglycan biosynthesis transporter [Candidatus Parcubacteria bacterium]